MPDRLALPDEAAMLIALLTLCSPSRDYLDKERIYARRDTAGVAFNGGDPNVVRMDHKHRLCLRYRKLFHEGSGYNRHEKRRTGGAPPREVARAVDHKRILIYR